MRPVRMNSDGLLAAVIYAVLEARRGCSPVVGFHVNIEVLPGAIADNQFGDISGSIQTDSDAQDIRNFKIWFSNKELVCEVTNDILVPKNTDNYNACYISCTGIEGLEIDFGKRTVRNRRTCTYNIANVNWYDINSIKGLAMDIIGGILAEKNTI